MAEPVGGSGRRTPLIDWRSPGPCRRFARWMWEPGCRRHTDGGRRHELNGRSNGQIGWGALRLLRRDSKAPGGDRRISVEIIMAADRAPGKSVCGEGEEAEPAESGRARARIAATRVPAKRFAGSGSDAARARLAILAAFEQRFDPMPPVSQDLAQLAGAVVGGVAAGCETISGPRLSRADRRSPGRPCACMAQVTSDRSAAAKHPGIAAAARPRRQGSADSGDGPHRI